MIRVETIETLNGILAYAGVAALVVTALLIIDMRGKRALAPYIVKWGLLATFVVALAGTVLSLVYSDVFGLVPCGLCWFERIMLYPQVLLVGTALIVRERTIPRYGIVLSTVGLVISLYHHYIQMGGGEFVRCPAAGVGADCAKRFMFELGFITFPLLGAISFALLIALYVYLRREYARS
ncbi:MAG TPA: disulfide bond formation protein B [Candidatus Paceibacterota bacterium]|nr:disulfide bond formation protein B [Candidatus Paceibacterota bacterium]